MTFKTSKLLCGKKTTMNSIVKNPLQIQCLDNGIFLADTIFWLKKSYLKWSKDFHKSFEVVFVQVTTVLDKTQRVSIAP